jgi:hypothetical protein
VAGRATPTVATGYLNSAEMMPPARAASSENDAVTEPVDRSSSNASWPVAAAIWLGVANRAPFRAFAADRGRGVDGHGVSACG